MSNIRLFFSDALSVNMIDKLDKDQSHYLSKVMRVKENELYVNEIAPRVHNSGHWTMDGSYSSQFQQHIRAIMDLPLLSTERHSDIIMYNLIGKVTSNLANNELAKVYVYGKKDSRPGRKMGHINLIKKKGS